jgi:hypothetical protein
VGVKLEKGHWVWVFDLGLKVQQKEWHQGHKIHTHQGLGFIVDVLALVPKRMAFSWKMTLLLKDNLFVGRSNSL